MSCLHCSIHATKLYLSVLSYFFPGLMIVLSSITLLCSIVPIPFLIILPTNSIDCLLWCCKHLSISSSLANILIFIFIFYGLLMYTVSFFKLAFKTFFVLIFFEPLDSLKLIAGYARKLEYPC